MKTKPPVHPFPARMAPDLALAHLPSKPCRVLDPMMGSGTIPVLASLQGHESFGFDTDPLAVLIARVWGRPLPEKPYLKAAERVTATARNLEQEVEKPVVDDGETQDFIDFWFDDEAQIRLAALAAAISREQRVEFKPALWCAFSRLIITKDAGASLARDVSHSRPHRVRKAASFNPIDRFQRAARSVVHRHSATAEKRPRNLLKLGRHDARALPLNDDSIDFVMTSPPYLNAAIDYLRSHRMSLVWMGHTIGGLTQLRAASVGSTSRLETDEFNDLITKAADESLSARHHAIVSQYISDLDEVISEISRVLTPNGHATLVVADGSLNGTIVRLETLTREVAAKHGLELTDQKARTIKASKRYLPPPSKSSSSLGKRMKKEVCLTFKAA